MKNFLFTFFAVYFAIACYAQPEEIVFPPEEIVLSLDSVMLIDGDYPPPPPMPGYENGAVVKKTPVPEGDKIFRIAEKMPVFQPNDREAVKYVASIPYNNLILEKGETATAYIEFVVDINGAATDPVLKRSSGYEELDTTALSYVLAMPKWIEPGYQDSKAVKVYYVVPFRFKRD